MRIDLSCPAETAGAELIREEDSWIRLILTNLTERPIDSCEATARILDREGNEIGRTVHRARSLRGRPHSAFSMIIPAELPETAAGAEATLDKIWFEDHDVWRRDPREEIEYEPNILPPGNELNALRYAAGKEAVGFPSQQPELWVCVCGRPNGNREMICARCRRSREMIFQQYNRNAVLRLVHQRERQLDLQTRGALEENNRLQRIREAEYNQARARRTRRRRLAAVLACAVILAAGTAFFGVPALRLWNAEEARQQGRLEDAREILTGLGNFPGAQERLAETERSIARRDGKIAAGNPNHFPTDRMKEIAADLRERGEEPEDAALADRVMVSAARAEMEGGDLDAAEETADGLPEGTEGLAELLRELTFARGGEALAAGEYERARTLFESLGDDAEAEEKAREAAYHLALRQMENGEYDEAIRELKALGTYRDSAELTAQCQYLKGYTLETRGETEAAREAYLAAGNWEDAAERAAAIRWAQAEAFLAAENYAEALPIYREMDGMEGAREKWILCATELARKAYKDREYIQAAAWLENLPEDTRETRQIRTRAYYLGAKAAAARGETAEAIELMEKVSDYSDAKKQIRNWRIALAQAKMDEGRYEEAREILAPIAEYSQAVKMIREIDAKTAPAEEGAENP